MLQVKEAHSKAAAQLEPMEAEVCELEAVIITNNTKCAVHLSVLLCGLQDRDTKMEKHDKQIRGVSITGGISVLIFFG